MKSANQPVYLCGYIQQSQEDSFHEGMVADGGCTADRSLNFKCTARPRANWKCQEQKLSVQYKLFTSTRGFHSVALTFTCEWHPLINLAYQRVSGSRYIIDIVHAYHVMPTARSSVSFPQLTGYLYLVSDSSYAPCAFFLVNLHRPIACVVLQFFS